MKFEEDQGEKFLGERLEKGRTAAEMKVLVEKVKQEIVKDVDLMIEETNEGEEESEKEDLEALLEVLSEV